MTTRNAHPLLVASTLMGLGLLVGCVDNGHVLGDTVQAGAAGEPGSTSSVGGTDASGAADGSGGRAQQDAGAGAATNARPSGGRSATPEGGSAGNPGPDGSTGGAAGGGSPGETGGVAVGVGGAAAGAGGTGGGAAGGTTGGSGGRSGTGGTTTGGTGGTTTGGTGGTTTGGTCGGGEGGNLSIPFEQAEQYACCASDEGCHVLYTSCSCAAVSTQVTELGGAVICDRNSCLEPDRDPPAAVCRSGRCTLVLDTGGMGGTGGCTGTLGEVLDRTFTACPATYDATDAWLRSCEGVSVLHWTSGYSGTCAGFLAAEVSWGTHGQTCYYDETSGEIVGAEVSDDVPTYCEATSGSMRGGAYPTECPLEELTFRGSCNCNDLVNVGTDVTPVDTAVEIPQGDGGTFVVGTYVLTEVRTYAGSSVAGDLHVMRQTLMIVGEGGLFVNLEAGVTRRTAFEFTVDGTAVAFTTTCSTDASSPDVPYSSFTADATAITLYSSADGMSVTYTAYEG